MLGSPDPLLASSSTLSPALTSSFASSNLIIIINVMINMVCGQYTDRPPYTRKLMFIHRFLVILAMATLPGLRAEARISPVMEEVRRRFKHHFVGKLVYYNLR